MGNNIRERRWERLLWVRKDPGLVVPTQKQSQSGPGSGKAYAGPVPGARLDVQCSEEEGCMTKLKEPSHWGLR